MYLSASVREENVEQTNNTDHRADDAYCGVCAELFTRLNEWLSGTFGTAQAVTFPYGNEYGWGIAHRNNKKLICHVFPEENAFTVMMRLSNKQFDSIYGKVQTGTQEQINHKYPCGDGGWLHYRVTCREQFDDIQTLITAKCAEAGLDNGVAGRNGGSSHGTV